jgi:hypothetical protein
MQELISIINRLPSEAWVALVTAILTSILTLLGVRSTNKSNNERVRIQLEHERLLKREELIRERLEEIYVKAKRYMNALVTHFLPYRKVMKGELTYDQALDLTINRNYSHNPERVHLIMDMYYPELKPTFSEVESTLSRINQILNGYKQQYKQGDDSGEEWLPLFQESLESLGKAASRFESHVAEIVRNSQQSHQN